MYRAHGLLLATTDFTLEAAAQRLAAQFPRHQLVAGDRKLTLTSGDWEMELVLEEGPHVVEDARRVAEHVGGAEDELGIRTCTRRVNVGTDIPDPEMDHFNDYLQVIEVLQTFRGLIAVDPKEPSLL